MNTAFNQLKMGILDLELMFDLLDTDMRGYLTSNQLQDFHESLYFSPIDPRQIEAAIRTVCGGASRGLCPREQFVDVLDELDRRKSLEEKIYWDFKTLDVEGKGRISLKTALLLFKAVHNELFSMKTWRSFVSQREYPDADVCFDEIKMFLCNLVDGGPCDKEEFDEEEKAVGVQCCNNEYRNLKELEKLQVHGWFDDICPRSGTTRLSGLAWFAKITFFLVSCNFAEPAQFPEISTLP